MTIPIEPQSYTIVDLNRGVGNKGGYRVWFEPLDGKDISRIMADTFRHNIVYRNIARSAEVYNTVKKTVEFFNTTGRFDKDFLEDALAEVSDN